MFNTKNRLLFTTIHANPLTRLLFVGRKNRKMFCKSVRQWVSIAVLRPTIVVNNDASRIFFDEWLPKRFIHVENGSNKI